MTYCPHCNEYIKDAFIDYTYSDSDYADDYSMDEYMQENSIEEDFGHVPITRSHLKRSREEAGLDDDLQSPGTKKKRLNETSSWGSIDFVAMDVDY